MRNIRYVVVLAVVTMVFSGCSKTWSGVKQDTNSAWKSTKKVVHDATA